MSRRSFLLTFLSHVLLPCGIAASAPCQDAPAKPPEVPLEIRLKILARDAREWVDRRRLAAWEELLTLGEAGSKVLLPIVTVKLDKDKKALEERFHGNELAHARKKVEEALDERRKVALACIFDRQRYPDEEHGIVGQPEVDRLVELVRDVWEHPASFTRNTTPEVETLAALLEEDVVYLEAAGGKPPAELPIVAAWLDRFNPGFEIERLGISDSQHEWNLAIAKYHAEELLTSADTEERACMDATNDYRRMLGIRILEIDERIVRAARKHSQEMAELGYFAHESPVPENRSPGMRCAREGYPGGGAENIAGGNETGVQAFSAWYHSSGHHRNLLGGHQQIGVGRVPGLWTQNFGGGSSLRGHKIEDPQILYIGKLKKLDAQSAESEAALAAWCHANKLEELAKQHAESALALDPEQEKAHEILGHVKVNGRWTIPPGGGTPAAVKSGGAPAPR